MARFAIAPLWVSPARNRFAIRGWRGALVAAIAFVFVAGGVAVAMGAQRLALWGVVQMCTANQTMFGRPFPCLKVDVSNGAGLGWAVLRPPFGPPDTILTPTTKIIGIEDPWLLSAEAPNYFRDAWNMRSFVQTRDGGRSARDNMAVGINSRMARSQDQLHIHIGCLTPDVWRPLQSIAPKLPINTWTDIGPIVEGADFHALRIASDDLNGVNPFRLAMDAFKGDEPFNPADLFLLVARLGDAGKNGEFVVLTSRAGNVRWPRAPSTDEVLDNVCASEN